MLRKIGLVLVVLLVALVLLIAMRPAEFRIVRSRIVAAPPAVVFGYVNDFRRWPEWSPWEKLDPAMKREVSTSSAGPGATYAWVGNSQVGEGRMTITGSRAPDYVTVRLEFLKPWAATNTAQFGFAPHAAGTNVTWAMTGENGFVAKAFALVVDVDQMLGAYFEQGLANLDTVTRGAVAPPAS